jgi:hypothetical protein
MADLRDCPVCGLVNVPGAARCDCDYEFESRPADPPRGSLPRPTRVSPRQARVESAVVGYGLLALVPFLVFGGLVAGVLRSDSYGSPVGSCAVCIVAVLLPVSAVGSAVYFLRGLK